MKFVPEVILVLCAIALSTEILGLVTGLLGQLKSTVDRTDTLFFVGSFTYIICYFGFIK